MFPTRQDPGGISSICADNETVLIATQDSGVIMSFDKGESFSVQNKGIFLKTYGIIAGYSQLISFERGKEAYRGTDLFNAYKFPNYGSNAFSVNKKSSKGYTFFQRENKLFWLSSDSTVDSIPVPAEKQKQHYVEEIFSWDTDGHRIALLYPDTSVFYSNNMGQTYHKLKVPVPSEEIVAGKNVFIDEERIQLWYWPTYLFTYNFKSKSWHTNPKEFETYTQVINQIILPEKEVLFTRENIYTKTNGGKWTIADEGIEGMKSAKISKEYASLLFLCTSENRLYWSSKKDLIWKEFPSPDTLHPIHDMVLLNDSLYLSISESGVYSAALDFVPQELVSTKYPPSFKSITSNSNHQKLEPSYFNLLGKRKRIRNTQHEVNVIHFGDSAGINILGEYQKRTDRNFNSRFKTQ